MSKLHRRKRHRAGISPAVAVGIIVMIGFGVAIGLVIGRNNAVDSYAGCTISEREDRAMAELAERAPRIYTDCGVFTVADEPLRFHFGAADVYNALEPGTRVDVTAVGWRIGVLSWFPNIIEATESPK